MLNDEYGGGGEKVFGYLQTSSLVIIETCQNEANAGVQI